MIRLPDIPGVQPQQINAPMVRPGAAAAPALALQGVAESIGNAGEMFHGIAMQVQKMENGRRESEERMKLGEEYAKLQLELDKDPDPANRIKRTQEFFAAYKGRLDAPDMPPALRESLMQHFDGFATNATIRTAEESSRLAVKRANLQFQNEYDEGVRTGDRATTERAVRTAVDAGALLPEEAERAMREFEREDAFNNARRAIAADPIAAERELNSPDFENPLLDDVQKSRLQREAEQEANRARADFFNDLIISGEMPKEDELAALEEGGWISKDTHARMKSQMRDVAPAFDAAIYNEAYTQVAEYDPAKDPSGSTIAQLRQWIGSQPLPKESIQELNRKITERANPREASGPKSEWEKMYASKIVTDFNRGDFGKYRFPVDHDDNPHTPPIFPVNAAEYDKAHRVRGQFTEAWRAELEKLPPESSHDQVRDAYDALKKTFKDRAPAPTLNIGAPSTAPLLPFDPDTTYRSTEPAPAFGGQPVQGPGGTYQNAKATVFGGANDPADNGLSAFGGKTGAGGKEGTAIPQKLLAAKFPGKNKAWLESNVRTVVRAPNGTMKVLPVVDLGTAEWVWQRAGRPTLDLTEGAAKELGGRPIYKDGKLRGLSGLDSLEFSVVSIDTGKPLAGSTWQDAKQAWFKQNKPRNMQAAEMSLIALREAWHQANAEDDPTALPLPEISATASDSLLPPRDS